jgi:hypothetical protein
MKGRRKLPATKRDSCETSTWWCSPGPGGRPKSATLLAVGRRRAGATRNQPIGRAAGPAERQSFTNQYHEEIMALAFAASER